MRKLLIGVTAASALTAVPVATAGAQGSHHHPAANTTRPAAAPNCSKTRTTHFLARGRFVSFTPSTTPGAAPTDGTLVVSVRHVNRTTHRWLRSIAPAGTHKPARLPRQVTFVLTGANVKFLKSGLSFANATSADVVSVHGSMVGPARHCTGPFTPTITRVLVRPARAHHHHHHHHSAATKTSGASRS